MIRDIEHRVNLTHYCPVCKRVVPFAPGVTRRAFVTIGVAHVCLAGTTRFHKWYESWEQTEHLELLLDSLEPVRGLPCAGCGNPMDSGTHPFCCPMDGGS